MRSYPLDSFLLSSYASGKRPLCTLASCALLGVACSGEASPGRDPDGTASTGVSAGTSGGQRAEASMLDADFGNTDATTMMMEWPDAGQADAASDDARAPDDNVCGTVVLEPMVNAVVEPGNLIVVFDNSGSMVAPWGDSPRWVVAGNALRDAVTSLSEYLTVGAILFPSGGTGCEVTPLDGDGQIPMLPGSAFVVAWDNFLRTNSPSGGTPLAEGMIAADAALQSTTRTGRTDVIVLTDGEPTCSVAELTSLPPLWLAAGTRTHVVGLPGSEAAAVTLEGIAAAGGTTTFLQPDNARALRRQIATIASEIVTSALESCTIPLDPPAPNPDDVHIVVTEAGVRHDADRDLDDGGGWRIDDEGTEIELFGFFCDRGLEGIYDRIAIEYGCVDLPPLPPPMGPE